MDFPYADAAGIIRANQKDMFVENDLFTQLRDVAQGFKGVRFTHRWSAEIQSFATLLYLSLTSLAGSRTLGEEYTDIFFLTPDRKIPSNLRVGLYVLTSGLTPLVLPRLSVKIKQWLSAWRKRRAAAASSGEKGGAVVSTAAGAVDEYDDDDDEEQIPSFLDEILTPATLVSLNLTIFYFSGAYYQLSKRLFGLRYAFGHRVDPLSQPTGSYELIGLLMIMRALFKTIAQLKEKLRTPELVAERQLNPREVGVTLEDESVLPFIKGQSRQCNLCLESMRAPTVTLCGHMFCWSCIAGWCRDQSECPLCRQECHEQHLLCLRV